MVLARMTYHQKATYWANPVQGGFGGITFDAPIILDVRWEDRVEEFVTVEGAEMRSKAVVHTQQETDLGGYLMLGETADTDPTAISGALKIQRSDQIPDLRGLNTSFRTFL